MKISTELKKRILEEYVLYEPQLKEFMTKRAWAKSFVTIPIMLDGVTDMIRYNVKESRFDELKICMARGNITTTDWLGKWVAFSDEIEFVTINL